MVYGRTNRDGPAGCSTPDGDDLSLKADMWLHAEVLAVSMKIVVETLACEELAVRVKRGKIRIVKSLTRRLHPDAAVCAICIRVPNTAEMSVPLEHNDIKTAFYG